MNNAKSIHWTTALKAMKEMTPPDSRNIYMRPQRSFFSPYEFVNQDGTGGSIVVSVCPDTGSPSFIGYRDKNGSLYLFLGKQLDTHRAVFEKILEQLALSFCGQDEPPSWWPDDEKHHEYWHDGKMSFEKYYWRISHQEPWRIPLITKYNHE